MGARPVSEHRTLPKLHGWDGPWAGLRVLVTGFGVTGFSVADTLAELGAHIVVVDGTATGTKQDDAATLSTMWGDRLEFRFGEDHTTTLRHFAAADGTTDIPELIVTSPGWRPDSPIIAAAAVHHVPVWSDIQLARRLGARPGAKTPTGWSSPEPTARPPLS